MTSVNITYVTILIGMVMLLEPLHHHLRKARRWPDLVVLSREQQHRPLDAFHRNSGLFHDSLIGEVAAYPSGDLALFTYFTL